MLGRSIDLRDIQIVATDSALELVDLHKEYLRPVNSKVRLFKKLPLFFSL